MRSLIDFGFIWFGWISQLNWSSQHFRWHKFFIFFLYSWCVQSDPWEKGYIKSKISSCIKMNNPVQIILFSYASTYQNHLMLLLTIQNKKLERVLMWNVIRGCLFNSFQKKVVVKSSCVYIFWSLQLNWELSRIFNGCTFSRRGTI